MARLVRLGRAGMQPSPATGSAAGTLAPSGAAAGRRHAVNRTSTVARSTPSSPGPRDRRHPCPQPLKRHTDSQDRMNHAVRPRQGPNGWPKVRPSGAAAGRDAVNPMSTAAPSTPPSPVPCDRGHRAATRWAGARPPTLAWTRQPGTSKGQKVDRWLTDPRRRPPGAVPLTGCQPLRRQLFACLFHATVGIRAARRRRGARTSRIAWTRQSGTGKGGTVDERLSEPRTRLPGAARLTEFQPLRRQLSLWLVHATVGIRVADRRGSAGSPRSM